MAEYIERGYLLAEYDRQHQGPPGKARELIANAPAADVAPVRHGRWIPYSVKDCLYICSECHGLPKDKTRYCPNCGARMDLEEEINVHRSE